MSKDKLNKVEEKASEVKEESKISFNFSDEEISEFKAWKARKKAQHTIVSDKEDRVYQMWKEERRIVKGVFRCRQPEGGSVNFSFRKYKWDPTKRYDLADGETYEIPLAVARHLNDNCGYPVHSHILGADGKPKRDVRGKIKSRMNFESTEFAAA